MIRPDTSERLRTDIADAGLRGVWVTPDGVADLPAMTGPAMTGAYALSLRLAHPVRLDLPTIDATELPPGWFVYAGSANGPGGVRARLARHFRREKRRHWHIDRLSVAASDMAALAVAGGVECDLVARLLQAPMFTMAAAGFGSSDCGRCAGHLLRYHLNRNR